MNSQIIYFSHGGGPLPILGDPTHTAMVKFMKDLPNIIDRPEAIIVISAHWEEAVVTVQGQEEPELMYDYYGFPSAAYDIKYPCHGNPKLAIKIADLLKDNGIECLVDNKRPYDHGVYIPLLMMYPSADIPVIQISLKQGLDPLTHLQIGKALRPLLSENVLVIGSGFSYHNMRNFDFAGQNTEDKINDSFQDRLIELCCEERDFNKRYNSFINWEKLPGARYCHPRSEHLMPLLVCVGMTDLLAKKIFDDYIIGKRAIAFLWNNA